MSTQDKSGKPWAKLHDTKEGDLLRLDGGFTCAKGHVQIYADKDGLYFSCSHGKHYLAGQAEDGEYLIGCYKV